MAVKMLLIPNIMKLFGFSAYFRYIKINLIANYFVVI